jgi:hypothetical protein
MDSNQTRLLVSLLRKVAAFFTYVWDTLDKSSGNRPYDYYIIFGQEDESYSPWLKSVWHSKVEPHLNRLLEQSAHIGETGIHVMKHKRLVGVDKKTKEEFAYYTDAEKLGRLTWNSKSHEKWTLATNAEEFFFNFELWTPRKTICDKTDSTPDVLIRLSNARNFDNTSPIQYGYTIIVAIAQIAQIDSKSIIKELSESINAKATVLRTRRWGKPETAGKWKWHNWIPDTYSAPTYEEKFLDVLEFDELPFEPAFEVIYKRPADR